jgi:hypothetical protein
MRIIVGLLLLALPLAGGCGVGPKKDPAVAPVVTENKNEDEKGDETTDAKPKPSSVQEKKKVQQAKVVEKKPPEPWGTLKGRIVWGGDKIPDPGFVDVTGNVNAAFCMAKGAIAQENAVVVDKKSKGVKDVFIWLTARTKDGKPPIHPSLEKPGAAPVVIDQPVCMFVPHALALRQGQTLLVKNSASITHSFKYGGTPDVNPGANDSIPAGKSLTITGLKVDRYPITVECALHPWMKAWIRVYDHPYFAVTDSDGKFEIKLAPAGSYQLMAWHSTGWLGGAQGRAGKTISIPEGGKDLGEIPFPPPSP